MSKERGAGNECPGDFPVGIQFDRRCLAVGLQTGAPNHPLCAASSERDPVRPIAASETDGVGVLCFERLDFRLRLLLRE